MGEGEEGLRREDVSSVGWVGWGRAGICALPLGENERNCAHGAFSEKRVSSKDSDVDSLELLPGAKSS